MAAPNIINITSMIGKTDTATLTTTSATNILDNPSGSGKVLRVTMIRAVNVNGSSSANITVGLYAASLGGAQTELIQLKPVSNNDKYDVITKETPLNMEEDTSIGATAGSANDIKMIVTYEEIS